MNVSMTFKYGFSSKFREVEIIVGCDYKVEPLNKRKNLKNQGRICTAQGFRNHLSSCGQHETNRVRVKWHDNEKYGFIDPRDLVPVNH